MEEQQMTLFGDAETLKELKRTTRAETFENYEEFVKKFEAKKTTDDCYTPRAVYDAILSFVSDICKLPGDTPIVRPFYPGGDYEAYEYPHGCVVVDNPPFSLLSKICRFYCAHKVPFFLFGPSLTLFTAPDCDLTYIIADADITYENGACVRTGFVTNMIEDARIWCCPELKGRIEKAQAIPNKQKKGFVYPDHIVTAATLQKVTDHGVNFRIPKDSCRFIRDSDSAKAQGRSLFGGGYILPDRYAALRVEADNQAAKNALQEKIADEYASAERIAADKKVATRIQLSPRERQIVKELNEQEIF